jgi:hypothetical protein
LIEVIQRVDVEDVGDLEADMAGLGIGNDDFSGAERAALDGSDGESDADA